MALLYHPTNENDEPPLCDFTILRRAARMHALGQVPIVSVAYAREMEALIAPAGFAGGFEFWWMNSFHELGVWSIVSLYDEGFMVSDYVR